MSQRLEIYDCFGTFVDKQRNGTGLRWEDEVRHFVVTSSLNRALDYAAGKFQATEQFDVYYDPQTIRRIGTLMTGEKQKPNITDELLRLATEVFTDKRRAEPDGLLRMISCYFTILD